MKTKDWDFGWPKVPRLLVSLALALALTACAGLGSIGDPQAAREASMFAACDSFKTSMRVVNTFEATMSEEQKVVVDRLVLIAPPACHAAEKGVDTTEATLNAVRDALREIVAMEYRVEVKP